MFYPYPKIRNIYRRNMKGGGRIEQGVYENDTFAYLAELPWEATLKLDGMNVGMVWDGYKISWQGRTELTTLTEPQTEFLASLATPEREEILEQKFGEEPAVIYGELIGKGVQACGAKYNPESYGFVVFDVYRPATDQWWNGAAVGAMAVALSLKVVPTIAVASLPDLVELTRQRMQDPMAVCQLEWEGLVARPCIPLKDNKTRVICKIKVRDVCEE